MPKKPASKPTKPAAEQAAPPDPNQPKVVGPGVVKRPKRDPSAPPPASQEPLEYTPSEQVFRRKV